MPLTDPVHVGRVTSAGTRTTQPSRGHQLERWRRAARISHWQPDRRQSAVRIWMSVQSVLPDRSKQKHMLVAQSIGEYGGAGVLGTLVTKVQSAASWVQTSVMEDRQEWIVGAIVLVVLY